MDYGTMSLTLLFFMFISEVNGHITLTYPPARKYAFDFMDNIRTIAPCGIPKGLGPITDLTVGQTITVHWHTAYPHKGGFRISLLDQNEEVISVLTPTSGTYAGASDPTTLSHSITLPNQECRNCSIQLIRQAGEWGTVGCGDYIFYSCADVNILPVNAPNNKCGQHMNADGTCICNPTYSGKQCTFKDDCSTNADCNNHGTCFMLSTTSFPQKQCYCEPGWHGRNCEHVSPIKEKITDFSSYKMTELSPEYKLYHKVLPDSNEIEVVMQVKSLTWVGLGWRPSNFRSGCQYFPHIPGLEPSTGPTQAPGSTNEPEPTHEPTQEPSPTSEPKPMCGGNWKSCNDDLCPYHAEWNYDVMKDEIRFTISAQASSSQWVAIGFSDDKFMSSSDVYMGFINSAGEVIVSDRWAAGWFPPTIDTSSNIKNITGIYSNGMLSISFSRKRDTGDTAQDVSFSDTYCPYFLFAYGGGFTETTTGYNISRHTNRFISQDRICVKPCALKSTPEPESTPKPESTPEPETTIEPAPEPKPAPACGDKWSYCLGGICYYTAVWNYDESTDEITFTISANTGQDKWLAIGFSDDRKMANSDMVMGYYNQATNTYMIRDRQSLSYYSRPTKDAIQNVELLSGKYDSTKMLLSLTFRRKRVTNDTTDFQITDTNCPYLLFAYGGSYSTDSDEPITKHYWMFATDNRICFKACDVSVNSKPGMCPQVSADTAGICVEECSADSQCSGDLKCCSNGCGHTCQTGVPMPEPETSSSPEPKATSTPEQTPEPGDTSIPENTPEPESTGTAEPEGEPSTCGGKPAGNSDTTGGRLFGMDCVDMVIGTTRGSLSRIGDYYTRDRSTPQYDSFYGGTESLTAAFGYDDNGYTTIIFRKKMTVTERADLPILNENMHVIWARGQDKGNYIHNPPTGIDNAPPNSLSVPDFYYEDELKYHGHMNHRGVVRINFLETETTTAPDTCSNTWGTCQDGSCHRVSWSYADNMISFTITADVSSDQWVGIGFNIERQMTNADALIGWVADNGQVTVLDVKNIKMYGLPTKDSTQNVQDIQGTRVGGRTTISFKRALSTGDAADHQFTEGNCAYFLYPLGGSFDNAGQTFTRHDATPPISSNKICFPCQAGNNVTTTSHMYTAEIKLKGILWNPDLLVTISTVYSNLKQEIEQDMARLFKNSPGFKSVWVRRFRSGSVIVEIGIEMTGNEPDTKAEVQRVLTDTVSGGALGGYALETSFPLGLSEAMPVEQVTTPPPSQHDHEEVHIAVWFIVGIASATLLLIIIMGLCNCAKNSQQQSSLEKKYEQFHTEKNGVGYGQQNKVIAGSLPHVKPQPYEKWLDVNKPEQYENTGYSVDEYKIETTVL